MWHNQVTDEFVLRGCDVNYSVREIHVQRPIRQPKRSPHVDEIQVRSAELSQFLINQSGTLYAMLDLIHERDDRLQVGGLGDWRRRSDDVSSHLPLSAELPDPLDISGCYVGDHRVNPATPLFSDLDEMHPDIHLAEHEENLIARTGTECIGNPELTESVHRHAAEFDDGIDGQGHRPSMTVSTHEGGH